MEPENISKILDDLKNRFASRFIFSFLIAWLIFNWRITVALLWYDKSQFRGCGCNTIFDFISYQLSHNDHYCKALISAISYTLLLPVSKSLINIWDEVILDLRNWTKTLLVRNQDAKTIADLKSKLNMVADFSIINGYWKVHSETRFHSANFNFQLYIENSEVYILEGEKKNQVSTILKIIYDVVNHEIVIIFKKEGYVNGANYSHYFSTNILKITFFENGIFKLEGTENNEHVTYTKFKN